MDAFLWGDLDIISQVHSESLTFPVRKLVPQFLRQLARLPYVDHSFIKTIICRN